MTSMNIRKFYKDVKSPILNFMDCLFDAIEMKDFELLEMVMPDYERTLARDPQFMTMLNTVCVKHFDGQSFKKENPMQAMLKTFLGGN
mmetsp:Transcript_67746/g.93804  ORF Transcript_67746/g.93804 Transcript_67746/m.93804 type:complete len:88 (+) Transcript_67746:571-834(+)